MIRRHGRLLRLLTMMVDALSAISLFVVVSVLRFGPADWQHVWQVSVGSTWLLLVGYAITWVALLGLHGSYRPRTHWSAQGEAAAIVRATVILGLVSFSALFLLDLVDVSRLVILILLPLQAITTILFRAGLRSVLGAARRRGRNLRRVIVVGTGPTALSFARQLEDHWSLGLIVDGLVGPVPDERTRWTILGSIDELPSILHDRIVDEVAISLPPEEAHRLESISRLAADQGKTVRIPLEIPAVALASGHVEDLDGTPVLSIVSGPDRELALAAKRFTDIVGAALGLIVLSPILLVIGIAIAASDGRPVLFRQPRAGLNGRPFAIAKYRTMERDADARRAELRTLNEIDGNASFKMTNDPRVTRLGGMLRRTSLDELPQLWNVLKGEMSLVGPRPHPFDDVAGYDDWHRRRLTMKPGITGLWQIGGRTEPSFDRWVIKDLEYIDRWSLWLDFRVIAKTVPALLRAEGR
jgi:exopolysaccharide biosynthesis polyprenyl glycosylphosphotransferase